MLNHYWYSSHTVLCLYQADQSIFFMLVYVSALQKYLLKLIKLKGLQVHQAQSHLIPFKHQFCVCTAAYGALLTPENVLFLCD